MPYPMATPDDVAFFEQHGYIVVVDAIDPDDLKQLEERCHEVIDHQHEMASDWNWEKGKDLSEREFKIVQAFPWRLWPGFMTDAPFRLWAVDFASALMGRPVEFWYDQFLAKPPRKGAETLWHQDEGYWGPSMSDAGITCWMPFHDVDASNGCMYFVDGGHRLGILEHRRPENVQSDLLYCEPDTSRAVAAPISRGSVTFHHSKMPHMTSANHTDQWRRILTQHLRLQGSEQRDDYPWRTYVDQLSPGMASHSPNGS